MEDKKEYYDELNEIEHSVYTRGKERPQVLVEKDVRLPAQYRDPDNEYQFSVSYDSEYASSDKAPSADLSGWSTSSLDTPEGPLTSRPGNFTPVRYADSSDSFSQIEIQSGIGVHNRKTAEAEFESMLWHRNLAEENFADTGLREDLQGAIIAAKKVVEAAKDLKRYIPNFLPEDIVYSPADTTWNKNPLSVISTVRHEIETAVCHLGRLLVSLEELFDWDTHQENIHDLNYTIKCLEEVRSQNSHEDRIGPLELLSILYRFRFQITDKTKDLRRLFSITKEALLEIPESDSVRLMEQLQHYVATFLLLYRRTRDKSTDENPLNMLFLAREYVNYALELRNDSNDPSLSRWTHFTSELAHVSLRLYEHTGMEMYLRRGIAEGNKIVNMERAMAKVQGEYLVVLSSLLSYRYDVWGELNDLLLAIQMARRAVHLPIRNEFGKLDTITAQIQLMESLLKRHEYWRRVKRPDDAAKDLHEASEILEHSIYRRPMRTASCCSASSKILQACSRLPEHHLDLDRAINLLRQAEHLTPNGHAKCGRRRFKLLGLVFMKAWKSNGNPSLEEMHNAIEEMQIMVDNTAEHHPDHAFYLSELCRFFNYEVRTKYRLIQQTHSSYPENQKEKETRLRIINYLDKCSRCRRVCMPSRINAAWMAADLHTLHKEFSAACPLFQRGVRLLYSLSPRGASLADQNHRIKSFAGLVSSAVANLLQVADQEEGIKRIQIQEQALQLREEGCGVLFGKLFELRSDFATLWLKHPEEAAKFKQCTDSIAALDFLAEDANKPFGLEAHRENLMTQYGNQLSAIRQLGDEFQDFLMPIGVSALKQAAVGGVVVVINANRHRSDAFIIQPNRDVEVLRLPDLNYGVALQWASLVRKKGVDMPREGMYELLKWLWDVLACPVLTLLDRLNPNFQSLTRVGNGTRQRKTRHRVCWIPNGPFRSLPLHAAGDYRISSGRRDRGECGYPDSVPSQTISSHSPSIKALLYTLQNASRVCLDPTSSPVMVAMSETPGVSQFLSFVPEEAALFKKIFEFKGKETVVLQEPKKSEVLKALRTASIFHFAGHGKSDPKDPLKSNLLLRDWQTNPLCVNDLIPLKLHENPPFLAYLSACDTGANRVDRLRDEGTHLMSACQLLGFQHVIGSLWPISDQHSVNVARHVYKRMASSGFTHSSVSQGLSEGMQYIMKNGDCSNYSSSEYGPQTPGLREGDSLDTPTPYWDDSDPRIWAAFIHIGLFDMHD